MDEVPYHTSLVPLAFPCSVLCLIGVETAGLFNYQGRAGIIAIAIALHGGVEKNIRGVAFFFQNFPPPGASPRNFRGTVYQNLSQNFCVVVWP